MDQEWASVLEYDANDFIIGGGMAVKLGYLQECKNYKCLLGNWQPFSEWDSQSIVYIKQSRFNSFSFIDWSFIAFDQTVVYLFWIFSKKFQIRSKKFDRNLILVLFHSKMQWI